MNVQLMNETAAKLRLRDIALRSHSVEISEGFDNAVALPNTSTNFRWRTAQIDNAEARDENNVVQFHRLRVWFEGVARIFTGDAEELPPGREPDPATVIATLKAIFVIEYHFSDDDKPSEEGIAEFGHHNARVHAWPYWREWMSAACVRTGLPLIILPMAAPPSQKR